MFNTVPDTKSNPIFSSYSVQNTDFNENMDEYVKAPNDIYIEQQQKNIKADIPKKNINKEALNNIKERPDFLKEEFDYVYKKPEWLEELEKNVATPEDIEEWKKKGAIGIGEVAKQAKKWGYATPYAGTTAEATMLIRNANTLRRLKNGQEVSPVDAELLYDFLREEKEKEVRGVTFAGKALDAIRVGAGYMAEFGLGLAAVPEAGIGLAAIGKTLTTIGGRKAARKAVESALKEAALKSAAPAATKKTLSLSAAKQIYKDTIAKTTGTKALANVGLKEGMQTTLKGLPRAVGTSAAFGSTFMSPHLVGDIANRQLATGIYITDFGDAVLTDSENLALSIMKAFGSSTFDVLTETAGWTFSPIANYFAKPIQKILPKKFFTEFEKLVSTRYGMDATQALKKYGYDGILEEMGEEVLNRFLCQVFGINGLDEYNFDGFMNNVFYANDPSQWAVEALSFAAVGGGARLAAGAGSRISDERKKREYNRDIARLTERANRYIQSPEQFYLEQGLIKIDGSQSLAEQRLREVWDEKNIDKNLQDEVLKNMSETEIRSELKKAIETKAENTTPEEATKRIEKDLTKKFVDNKIFSKEKDAKTVAALFAAPLQKLSETTGMSLEEVMEEEMPEIQREAEQAARDNGRYVQVDGRIEEIFNELNELPDNFNDEKYLERLMKEVDILSKARDGILTDTERKEAIQFANILQQNGEIEFANELKEILNIEGEKQLFQAASSAGAENNEIDAVQKEWKEKGIGSKYFKRWFGDSKVVDENGRPLIVYHGSKVADIKEFDSNKSNYGHISVGFNFFTNNKNGEGESAEFYAGNNGTIYECYISMKNPLVYNATGWKDEGVEYKTPVEFFDTNKGEIKREYRKGDYDGIIVKVGDNTIYAVPNSEQIKSVNNQGTFDTENPNIYYQSSNSNYQEQLQEIKSNLEYKKFVNKVLSDGLSKKEKSKPFQIGKTPAKLIEAGFPENNVSIGYKVIEKAQNNKNADHNLSKETISEVWQALKNPIAVIKVEQNKNEKEINNRYSVILDLQNDNGHYVLAAFEIDKKDGNVLFNDIRSIHSRRNYEPIIDKALNDKRLIKVDAEKIKNLLTPKVQPDIISGGAASLIERINQQKNNVKFYQSAYHGTPHRFDEFSLDNIGTGEGAQAHGWGLYFAESKDISENYRKSLTGDDFDNEQYFYDDNLIEDRNKKAILATIEKNGIGKVIQVREKNIEKYKYDKAEYQTKKTELEWIKTLEENKIQKKTDKGQLFKVDIPESDVLIDEDKHLQQQNKNVKNILYELDKEFKNKLLTYGNDLSGYGIYKTLSRLTGSDKAASEKLNEYGIKGITYDGAQDGRCYVIFDDKAIDVVETYYQGENEPIQTNMLYDNITPRRLRNMNIKGAFVPAENLIELFKNADESTIIHEFAHWWLSRLEKYAPNNEELTLDLEEVRKFLKNDGSPFTREQHEKFAVGFEAYIRNGSARSNRLKKIFEDFKNALIQIYDSIKQLVYTEDGQQYSFSEADVANLERLFERLLTTENERIKKTVFDRCDDINERIKEIKARQEEEMKELDELWKGNIEANNRASDKKRKVEEYLELAETSVSRVPKEVREMQQRYKDATLSILSAATGMKKNVIANPRNWEKVKIALENADDKITTSGGMRAEWEEFYSDTGVSYDNDEIGGDYELAQQAFNVLTDGTYNFGNMNEDEIGRFYGKFEYLYNKVQTLKGEEKSTALEALYSLFGDMPSMPDEVVEDVVGKLDKIEIEYNEGQKEDFNRKRYPNIPVVQQLQHYVTNKLNDLRVYDPNVRYKVRITKSHNLYKTIKGATSVNATKRIIRKINEYVISDLENQAKSILHKEIQKQIKTSSKLVKVGTLKKGKFDWKTNSVFAELAEINKLKQKEAFSQYGAMVDIDKAAAGEERENNSDSPTSTSELKTDFQSNLKRKFLEYRSSKIKDLNLAATRSLLEDIMTLKFEGRRAKDAQELERQLQRDNMKTDLVQRVRELKGNKAATGIAKFIMGETFVTSEKTLANWETSLNALFGKEVAQRYSLLRLESDAEIYAWKRYSNFCKKAIEIYGLNNPVNIGQKAWNKFNEFIDFANNQPLVTLMQNYESEVYNYKEVTYSKETGQFVESGVQLSRAEIITLYAWAQNEELEQRIFTQYGIAQVQHMFEQVLSEEDKQFAWLLIDTCDNMYDDTNEVFIRTMGLSLPKVENYFPSKTVRIGSEIDMLHENMVRSSNPSFIKERKNCKRIKMKPEQPLSILLPHLNKTARYVILSERLNYLNAIFKDATVRAAIKEVFDGVETPDKIQAGSKVKGRKNKKQRTTGDRIHDTLLNQLGSSTFENYVRGLNTGKNWMDALATNYITSRIGGNLKVAIGQLTGMINYCEKMPAGMWAKGFAECLKNPKETVKYMVENCDYLNARLAGNSMNEVMLKITDEADRFRTLRNFCITNTKYGDLLAISFGGKPYVDYLMSQGMTKEEAFDKFVEETMRAQQAGQASATSVWQKKMSENPWTRMLFAFNNTTLQFERKFVDAMASRARGEISNRELIKAILIYKVFNPVLFTTFLSNLSFMTLIRGLTGDDDDGVEKFGIDMLTSILFANLAAYGGTGVIASTIGSFLMTLFDKKEYKPFLKSVPIIGDVEKIGKSILMKNEITVSDWVDAMALVTDDLTGVPATRMVNSATGIGDIVNGDAAVGLLKLIGYGNYRANVAVTGEPPERNRK